MPTPKKYNGTINERAVLDVNRWIKNLKKEIWRNLYKELTRRPTRKEVSSRLPETLKKTKVMTVSPNGEKRVHKYLTYTTIPCNLGGVRHYFRCPFCGSRRVKLYCCGDFACRECANLTYERDRGRHCRFEYLFKTLTLYKEIDQEKEKIKYPYWRERLTRKAQALLKKVQKANIYGVIALKSQKDSGIDEKNDKER